MEVNAYEVEPLTVEASIHERNFRINGMSPGKNYDEQYVAFSGYFGIWGPHVFAAAPEMFSALRAARDIVAANCDGIYEVAVLEDIDAALAKAEGLS